MKRTAGDLATVLTLVTLLSLSYSTVSANEDEEPKVFQDPEGDVVIDTENGDLQSARDLDDLEGREAPDSTEIQYVDILALRVGGDDTYVEFQLEMSGFILARPEYTYAIAGYSQESPSRSDKFDFMIVFNNGSTTHKTWGQGRFEKASNISEITIVDNLLNITVHREKFSLSNREDPYLLCAFVYLEQGEEGGKTLDYLISESEKEDGFNLFDEENLLLLQLGFFFLLFTAILIIYNIWSKKKGEEFSGGVCPHCESKLDPNLDFCPSCGNVIRGPGSDKAQQGEPYPPEE